MIEVITVQLDPAWIQILETYETIYLGFSGGLDSTVLLHLLAKEPSLKLRTRAVHINHGLSPNAKAWEAHSQRCCQALGIAFQSIAVSLSCQANIEEAARKARYAAWEILVQTNQCLLTAHHQDDQAETLLLHLFRGTGMKGLAGINATLPFGQGHLHRPLLTIPRENLQAYALVCGLTWIEDESNQDVNFSRNFIRQQVLPLVETKWPGASKNLARTSSLCREALSNLTELAAIDSPTLCEALQNPTVPAPQILPLEPLLGLSAPRLANVLRAWLQTHAIKNPNSATFKRLISEVIAAKPDAHPQLAWDEWLIRRYQDKLYLFNTKEKEQGLLCPVTWTSFPSPLLLPERGILTANLANSGFQVSKPCQIEIRFRQGGETFLFNGHRRSLKKLMQEWRILPWLRARTPLLYVNGDLAAVLGYAVGDQYYKNNGKACYELELVDRF